MTDSKDEAKQVKKAAKAELKGLKKMARAQAASAPASTSAPTGEPSQTTGPTPAERSAAAAERQVRLQHFRVWLALAAVIVGVITILVTIKSWNGDAHETTTRDATPSTQSAAP